MKTAVEWFVQELHDNGYFHEGVPEDLVKKAKAMEKEQIIEAHHSASIEQGALSKDLANDYYNETFKSE
jgi:hypothetical protein